MLGNEVSRSTRDVTLLMLERMRMVDTANHWRDSTTKLYTRLLQKLHKFEVWSSIPTLVKPSLLQPSSSPCFSLMYAQLQYSVEKNGRKFQTVRQLRSAASGWYSQVLSNPDMTHHLSFSNPCESQLYRLFTEGMSRRMGIEVNPSMALSHAQVEFVDQFLEVQWNLAASRDQQLEVAAAGSANLIAWMGWLRASEIFSLLAEDVQVILPGDGKLYGLPPGVGAVVLNLLPMTKSNPTSAGDVVLAYQSLSDLSAGKWIGRLLSLQPPSGLLFSTPACDHWTSRHFRQVWLYPLLECLRLQGDVSLKIFKSSDDIRQAFYSMHLYRRGGRSRAERKARHNKRPHPKQRITTEPQVREHGR